MLCLIDLGLIHVSDDMGLIWQRVFVPSLVGELRHMPPTLLGLLARLPHPTHYTVRLLHVPIYSQAYTSVE